MRPGISYTQQGNPYMQNPGSFAFGRAQPKSSDKQQGPLAEPPKQNSQAAQKQFGSAQASGDYSAYSPSGANSAYSRQAEAPSAQQNPQYQTQVRQRPAGWPPGYSGPGSSPMEQMPRALPPPPPDSNGDGVSDVNGAPVSVQRPDGAQRQIDEMKRRGTWDDPRNAKARARLEKQVADINEAPPGYFKTPDGRFEPNYIGTLQGGFGGQQRSPVVDMRALYPTDPQQQADIGMRLGPGQSLSPVPGLPGMGEVQPAPTYAMPPRQYVFPLQGQGQQFYNQRDAFINNINTSLGQQMMQNFGSSQPVAPQLNIPQLWNQAGEMAANGWTNPLAALIGNV